MLQVVQLPQTISIASPDKAAVTDEAINSLPPGMFTFMGRSGDSVQHAQQHYLNTAVVAAPDLAWSLGPLMPSGPPEVDVLFALRSDHEAAPDERDLLKLFAKANRAPHGTQSLGSKGTQYAALLQRFSDAGITYAIRDWDFTRERGMSYRSEVSQVRCWWCIGVPGRCCKPGSLAWFSAPTSHLLI